MTAEDIGERGAACVWFVDNKQHRAIFASEALETSDRKLSYG
jgi:hypothetical protein